MSARAIAPSPGTAAHALAEDGRWWHRAACLGADTGIFFAHPDEAPLKIAEAKAFCGRCPVRTACLDEAVRTGDMHAVRGGTTWPERRDVIPRRNDWCLAGLHRRTPENTYTDGKCRPCRLARAARDRAAARAARPGSSSPQSGKKAA